MREWLIGLGGPVPAVLLTGTALIVLARRLPEGTERLLGSRLVGAGP